MILSLITILMLGFLSSTVSAFSGSGAGTSGNPYQITNCDQLQEMNNNLAANYILINDIDCSATSGWNSGAGFLPISTFTGTFDGQNHIISKLFINRPSLDQVGLFGISSGIIENVGLVNVDILGSTSQYSDTGGLVSYNFGTITNSYSTGSVSGSGDVGGLVSYNSGIITNSYSTGSVSGSAGSHAGGLVGLNSGAIENSYSTGDVTSSGYATGGLVGYESHGTVTNSYATGSVSGASFVGGLIGSNSGTITSSYATGSVSGTGGSIGGLIGWNYGTVTSSYWDIQTSGQSTSADGIGKTTAEMKTQSTFVGWDFNNIWSINSHENNGYPYLLPEQIPPMVPEFGLIAGITTVLGALGMFFFVRKK